MFASLMQKFYVPDQGDYQLSGRYSLIGLSLALGASSLFTLFVSYIYSLAVTFIPIIYLNVLITASLGIAIGFCVMLSSKIALIRNKNVRLLIAVIVSALAVITQWMVYLFFLTTGKAPIQGNIAEGQFLLDITTLKNIFTTLYTYGSWTVFGITVNGALLLSIWIVEALIIMAAPLLILTKHPIPPFSEKLNKWYKKRTLAQDFAYISGINSFINELRDSKAANLLNYPKGDGNRHARIIIYYIEQEDKAYLSADNIFITSGKESNKDIDPVVRFVAIPSHVASELIKKHGTKAWSYNDVI